MVIFTQLPMKTIIEKPYLQDLQFFGRESQSEFRILFVGNNFFITPSKKKLLDALNFFYKAWLLESQDQV